MKTFSDIEQEKLREAFEALVMNMGPAPELDDLIGPSGRVGVAAQPRRRGLVVAAALVVSLVALGLTALFTSDKGDSLSGAQDRGDVIVFFESGTPLGTLMDIADEVMTWEGVSLASPWTSQEAAQEFAELFADQPELVQVIQDDPSVLPASVRIWVEPGTDVSVVAQRARDEFDDALEVSVTGDESQASGIAGSLLTTDGQLVDGQVLVWAISAELVGTSTTIGMFLRPTEQAFTTGGHYHVDLEPGGYLVRANVVEQVCDEFQVDVVPGTILTVDFTCSGTEMAGATTNNGESAVTTIAVPTQLESGGIALQDEILADGQVSRDEFVRAVSRMAACMIENGLTGVTWSVDADGGGWSNGYNSPAGDAAEQAIESLCYYSYVDRVGGNQWGPTRLLVEAELFLPVLEELDAQVLAFLNRANRIDSDWENRQATFANTRSALTSLRTDLEIWTQSLAQRVDIPSSLESPYAALLDETSELPAGVEAILLGLQAPDDGTERRTGVAAFVQEALDVVYAIDTLRGGG